MMIPCTLLPEFRLHAAICDAVVEVLFTRTCEMLMERKLRRIYDKAV